MTFPAYGAIASLGTGDPAGSTLRLSIAVKSSVHTLLLDRMNFPRVKLLWWLALNSPSGILSEKVTTSIPRIAYEFSHIHIRFHG